MAALGELSALAELTQSASGQLSSVLETSVVRLSYLKSSIILELGVFRGRYPNSDQRPYTGEYTERSKKLQVSVVTSIIFC